jgi:arylsulfatase A-like enzyme
LEGGVRVPFFLCWPGHIPAGTFDHPVIQLDILPTVLAAAGIEASPEEQLDGVNLLPHVTEKPSKPGQHIEAPPPHAALFWRFGQQMAARQGRWKLVRYDQVADGGQGISPARLYDLEADLGETRDLAAAEPEKVKELQAAWDAWNVGNIAPRWTGRGATPGKAKKR